MTAISNRPHSTINIQTLHQRSAFIALLVLVLSGCTSSSPGHFDWVNQENGAVGATCTSRYKPCDTMSTAYANDYSRCEKEAEKVVIPAANCRAQVLNCKSRKNLENTLCDYQQYQRPGKTCDDSAVNAAIRKQRRALEDCLGAAGWEKKQVTHPET